MRNQAGTALAVIFVLGACRAAQGATIADGNWVNQVYLDLLHRPVDPAGLANAVLALDANVTRSAFVFGITGTAEYRTVLVDDLYNSLLNRPPTPGEGATAILDLSNGVTDEQEGAQLIGLNEYYNGPGGGTDAGFVNILYNDLLHRNPGSNELLQNLQLLSNATPHSAIALNIYGSQEYRIDLVNTFYLEFLRRGPQPAETNVAVNFLNANGTDEQLIALLLGSTEYYGLAQTSQTPEPATNGLLVAAIAAGLVVRRRKYISRF